MWFRRRRRERRPDLSSLEQSLDRLLELVEHILELLPAVAARESNPAAPVWVPPEPEPEPGPEPEPVEPVPEPHGYVLFVGAASGYRLLVRNSAPPGCGEVVELDDVAYVVLRLGPSPLPDDRRRCAFLERQELWPPERTSSA